MCLINECLLRWSDLLNTLGVIIKRSRLVNTCSTEGSTMLPTCIPAYQSYAQFLFLHKHLPVFSGFSWDPIQVKSIMILWSFHINYVLTMYILVEQTLLCCNHIKGFLEYSFHMANKAFTYNFGNLYTVLYNFYIIYFEFFKIIKNISNMPCYYHSFA